MHVLFVHQNFPAQFGHIARHLAVEHGWQCTFVTNADVRSTSSITILQYRPNGGATEQTSYFTRTFENAVGHAHGVYEVCKANVHLKPDLVVGHSGFGSTLFLREVFDCPIINYFEYFYHRHDSDLDFRPDFPPSDRNVLRSYCRNAMLHLDLQNCDAGYSPTHWQKSRFPACFADKIDVIFDGVDTDVWRQQPELRLPGPHRRIAGRAIVDDVKLVTYVSRGFESMRGFDIFMRTAKRIYEQFPNVLFVVIGTDRIAYGGDRHHIRGKSFREHVLSQDHFDRSKFLFTGLLPPVELARILAMSDVHMYLTVPFVLSWSLFNALACGTVVVASDTAPVRELVKHGENGLLADFFDVDGLAAQALTVLRDPGSFRQLGEAGAARIRTAYALQVSLPKLVYLFQRNVVKHS